MGFLLGLPLKLLVLVFAPVLPPPTAPAAPAACPAALAAAETFVPFWLSMMAAIFCSCAAICCNCWYSVPF